MVPISTHWLREDPDLLEDDEDVEYLLTALNWNHVESMYYDERARRVYIDMVSKRTYSTRPGVDIPELLEEARRQGIYTGTTS